jgi:guanylate kinase
MKRFILVGCAASGKDHMRKRFEEKGLKYAVSYTTRPPREGEVNGKDYFFISDEEASRMIAANEFYEWVQFNGWIYGTTVEQMSHDDIFIMTPKGLSHVKPEDRKESIVLYFDIAEQIRKERLAARHMPGDTLARRIEADRLDFENFIDYDIRIANSNF